MHPIEIDPENPRALSQACVQVCELLGLYQAELARILGLQCRDIGRLARGEWLLQPGIGAWGRAQALLRVYQRLYEHLSGEPVAMVHWLRVPLDGIGSTPHRLMVDEGRLDEVLAWLEGRAP